MAPVWCTWARVPAAVSQMHGRGTRVYGDKKFSRIAVSPPGAGMFRARIPPGIPVGGVNSRQGAQCTREPHVPPKTWVMPGNRVSPDPADKNQAPGIPVPGMLGTWVYPGLGYTRVRVPDTPGKCVSKSEGLTLSGSEVGTNRAASNRKSSMVVV